MGYKNQIIKGATWLGAFRGVSRIISFLRTALLARILNPSQFGFFAVASLVLALTELITETGINIVLVQKKEQIDKYINTAWIVSIVRGFFIGFIIILSAPLISLFFEMSQVLPLVFLISVVPVIRGFINPSRVKLMKDLRFRDEFFYNSSLFFVETIVTLIFAYYTRNASSLVFGLIAGSIFDVIASFIIFKPFPQPLFNKAIFLDIFKHGRWFTLAGVINYLYQNADNIVVGKILGASSLGLYDVAYKISILPMTEIADVIGRTTFPVYVKINDDIPRLRKAYYKTLIFIFSFSLVIAILLYFFSYQIINIILGSQWLGAVPVLQVLGFFGLLRAILTSIMFPFYSVQRQKDVTLILAIGLVVLLITIIPFVSMWGIVGAAYSAILGTLFSIPLAFFYLRKILYAKVSN